MSSKVASEGVSERSNPPTNSEQSTFSSFQSIGHSPNKVFAFLFAYRLLNALVVRTFFQPDEYYQSLEPAWWLAFGESSGAWITWEWKQGLRSALLPALLAVTYKTSDTVANFLHLSHSLRADVLLIAPKVVQACLAAIGDFYTYKLARQIYGKNSASTSLTLVLTVGSAWQWFCATRTFSNCAETTLTVVALYNWPFHWALGADEVGFQVDTGVLRVRETDGPTESGIDESTRIRRALLCAGTAVVLRPTNIVIWLVLILATFGRGMWHHGIHWEVNAFIREGLLCGSMVLSLSALTDRIFYQAWIFPPWNFLKFNVLQSLAVFYGNNDWHYYLSQGFPLLLTAAILPAGAGVYQSLISRRMPEALSIQARLTLHRLALIVVALPAALSVLSHKEVRFIYPVLPALHILAAMPLGRALNLIDPSGKNISTHEHALSLNWRVLVLVLGMVNVAIALYASVIHNSGIITVTDFLRSEHEKSLDDITSKGSANLTFAAFMPCHSIPWRSHLQYPGTESESGISGWALTCEPPLNLNSSAKEGYLDEADVFYLDPLAWINRNMLRDLPPPLQHKPGVYASDAANSKKLWTNPRRNHGVWLQQGEGGTKTKRSRKARSWPDYVIFFEHLEPVMRRVLSNSAYHECQRFFNSHAHDDSRRKGDVVVWCTRPEVQSAR